ncbi:LCP family protein [Bacillus massiliigorillae]|uniref:LCP family protein n=1 Tax=Bacillus massiliigorillae TaxID=1243664 RepID=UPI00039F6AF1|nr:LCP family protein [Bacillus massiliigorillae]
MSRVKKRKLKQRKRVLFIFTVLVLLIVLPSSYFAWEYYSGYKVGEKVSELNKKEIKFKGAPFQGTMNVLLIGGDSRGAESGNSDTIMIAQYDTKSKQAKLVSLMRDIYIAIPGHEQKQKINAAYSIGGPDLLRETIKENFDIDINYYAIIDFRGFMEGIDAAFPDGVEINVEKRMSKNIYVTLEPGLQKLNGKELLGYARFRGDAQSDFGRVVRQQKVLQTITNEMISIQGVAKLPKMLGTVRPFIDTNIENTRMLKVLTSFLTSGNSNIEKLRIPLVDSFEDATLDDQYRTQVLDIDFDKNKEALKKFLQT